MVRNGVWYLRNSLTSGVADIVVTYGNPGDTPIVGYWSSPGAPGMPIGIGVVRNGTWYLRGSAASGEATTTFGYGNPGDTPIVGNIRWGDVFGPPCA